MADPSAKPSTKTAGQPRSALPLWVRVVALLVLLPLLALGVFALLHSQAALSGVHKRNFHLVNIAARNLETWPRDVAGLARGIAKSSPNPKEPARRFHPALGPYAITFGPSAGDKGGCPTPANGAPLAEGEFAINFVPEAHPGEGTGLNVSGSTVVPQAPDAGPTAALPDAASRCFVAQVPLARLLHLDIDGQTIAHLLIVDRTGRIVQQVGKPALNVDRVDGLVTVDALAKGIVAASEVGLGHDDKAGKPAAERVDIGNVSKVVNFEVGGDSYLAYFKPFAVPGAASQPCRTGSNAGSTAAQSAPGSCYIVALVPRSSIPADLLARMPIQRTELTFGLLFVVLLVPLLRFLMIGGAEAAGRLEVLGIVAGLPAALAVACFALMFVVDIRAGRIQAATDTAGAAQDLASRAAGEIAERRQAMDRLIRAGGTDQALHDSDGRLFTSLWRLDDTGRVAPSAETSASPGPGRITALDQSDPATLDIAGRGYFRQLGEDPPCPAQTGTVPPPWSLGVVRSQLQGFDSAALLVQGPAPQAGQRPLLYLGAFQVGGLIAPLLSAPTHFMVIDTAAPDDEGARLPVIFHYERGHAGSEFFRDQADIDDRLVGQLRDLPARCKRKSEAGGATRDDEEALHFEATYDGEPALFAARAISGTRWVVLTWQHYADTDLAAARTGLFALGDLGAIVVLVTLAMTASVWLWLQLHGRFGPIESRAVPRAPWRMLWPHEAAVDSYGWLWVALAAWSLLVFATAFARWATPSRFYGLDLMMPLVGALGGLFGALIPHRLGVAKTRSERLAESLEARWRWSKTAASAAPTVACALIGLVLGALLALVLGLLQGGPLGGALYFVLALVSMAGAAVLLLAFLSGWKDSLDPLSRLTEQRYGAAVRVTLLSIAIVPALTVWLDARGFAYHLRDADRLAALTADIKERDRTLKLIARATCDPAAKGNASVAERCRNFSTHLEESGKLSPTVGATFSWASGNELLASSLWRVATGSTVPTAVYFVPHKDDKGWPQTESRRYDAWYAIDGRPASDTPYGLAMRRFAFPPFAPYDWVLLAIGLAIVVTLWRVLPRYLLNSLTGFGVPLGAVEDNLKVRTAKLTNFPYRTLLVGTDMKVRQRLAAEASPLLDLADMLMHLEDNELSPAKVKLAAQDYFGKVTEQPGTKSLVVQGLSLLLRDPLRRAAALIYLEEAARRCSAGKLDRIVILSDMAPLDRILDAFESDGKPDGVESKGREELRWARLFETFSTITAQRTKQPWVGRMRKVIEAWSSPDRAGKDETGVGYTLLHELRYVPPEIIATLNSHFHTDNSSTSLLDKYLAAKKDHPCTEKDLENVEQWLKDRGFRTPAAVIDYLRSNLIEYYEQLWFDSSNAERLVLDAIARGQYVNMRRALALKSLVRRGLVVLEPAPQLFNLSFAMFVRQAERPETIEDWRNRQPKGQWNWARWPLLLIAPAGLIAVSYAAMVEGESLEAVIPALLAAIPALIGLFTRKAFSSNAP